MRIITSELPTMGMFYSKWALKQFELEPITPEDDYIMSNAELYNNGTLLEKLFMAKIKNFPKDMKFTDLYNVDVDWAILQLRADMDANYTFTMEGQTFTYDLTQIGATDMGDLPMKPNEKDLFSCKLGDGTVIYYKMLNVGEERQVAEMHRQHKASKPKKPKSEKLIFVESSIREIHNPDKTIVTDRYKIEEYVKNMPYPSFLFLNKFIRNSFPKVNFEVEVQKDGGTFRTLLPITYQFFLPDGGDVA